MKNSVRLRLCRARLLRARQLMEEVRCEIDLVDHNLAAMERLDERIDKAKGRQNHGTQTHANV